MNSSLNHVYRIIWNAALGLWQVASEATRGRGKTGSSQQARKARRALAAATAMTLASPAAWAVLPTGGNVVAGSATISQAGSALNINQASDKAAINWQSFSIGQGNSVNFVQPSSSSVALNRVLGNDVSVIQGAINANGQVFLVNQNGVLFTPTAQVNVGGIVASTQNISTADFMAGKYEFSGNSTATVENQGSISAANGGVVALVAAKVINSGTITAPQGTVGLAAGNTVLLDLGGPVKIQVTEGALNAAIEQSGGIRADGGTIYLTAKAAGNLAASVINHSGVTRALTMASLTGEPQGQTGSIALSADIISQGGTLDASGTQAGTSGGHIDLTAGLIIDSGTTKADGQVDGGRITQSANEIMQSSSAKVSAVGVTGLGGLIQFLGGGQSGGNVYLSGRTLATGRRKGGQIDATAHSLTLAGATINTSGTDANALAGKIRIGGGWQGQEADLANAQSTVLNRETTITNTGANGTVVAWSDQLTTYAAALDAVGSKVEISGKDTLVANLDHVKAQSLLLDPKNIEIKESSAPALNVLSIVNPNNTAGDLFGGSVTELANGNLVIAASSSDIAGTTTVTNVGRVYLYSSTGSLISTLSGSSASDQVGTGISVLTQNNTFVARTSSWTNAGAASAGAVTWVDGNTGKLSNGSTGGVVSATNSLVGDATGDQIGVNGILALNNGHYAVISARWRSANSTTAGLGAVTWVNGSTGKLTTGATGGAVSSSNSLVGTVAGDRVGGPGLQQLTNGNLVVRSAFWNSGTVMVSSQGKGAVTWMNGTNGQLADGSAAGAVSAANSLVGSTMGDRVGELAVTLLSNGNYVATSAFWTNSGVAGAGAATWVNGSTGKLVTGSAGGAVSAANSLVGSKASDAVGSEISTLSNGNYVLRSKSWDNGSVSNVGAVTWVNGSTGQLVGGATAGAVSATNSLVGSTANDLVGENGITLLTNDHFVVRSISWDGAGKNDVGAVTWMNGTNGKLADGSAAGAISASNSLVGSTAIDNIGAGGVVALSNGHYVVASPFWDGVEVDVGAVTWANGATGLTGTIDATNSLVGSSINDKIGQSVTALIGNGNYVVRSHLWNNGGLDGNAFGAVTWANGATGLTGTIDATNSLVGGKAGNQVGSTEVLALSGGNYVVRSNGWDSDTADNVGAVTWGDGSTGRTGVVSTANSLVGSTANDQIGNSGLTTLSNGNYVVRSGNWENAGATNAGAVTWMDGSTGKLADGRAGGEVSTANSLVGSSLGDSVGNSGISILNNGHFVVRSEQWDGAAADVGAVTWVSGSTGKLANGSTGGAVSVSNSLVGSTLSDKVGNNFLALSNGNYVVRSNNWDSGPLTNAGAVTFVNGSNGYLAGSTSGGGTISTANSIIGNRANAGLGPLVSLLANGRLAVRDTGDTAGGTVYISDGSTTGFATDAVTSATFATNPGANNIITPGSITALLNAGTAVTLQANNDITVTDAVTANNANGDGGAFTLEAGRNINLNAGITTDDGNFTAIAGSANAVAEHRDAGDSTITLASGVSLNAGTGTINLVANNVGTNLGKFVNNAGATPFTAAKTFIYLPSFNTTGNNGVTHATLGGLTTNGKRYNTMFNATTGAPTSTTANLQNLNGVNLLYAAAPVITVTPSNYSVTYGDDIAFENSPLTGFVDGDSAATTGAVNGTEVLEIVGVDPVNGLRNAGKYNLVYKSGYKSDLGYAFADANTQINELTITPRALAITTNDFVSSPLATAAIANTTGLVSNQSVSAVNVSGKNVSVAFGENTLASNYATTLVLPSAAGSDLNVNRDLTLAEGLNLTLRSDKNINNNSVIDATAGTGSKVTIEYGQGAVAASNTAQYILKLTNDGFTGKVNLKAGQNFSTKLGSDGTLTNFTVVTALGAQGSRTKADLQGITGDRSGRYVLGADIDARDTATWNNGAGFEPIDGGAAGGATPRPFQGIFDGLGHTVNNLQINSASSVVGLFALTRSAELRHVGLEGGQVSGGNKDRIGALVGEVTNSSIRHVYAKTAVTGVVAGGLVGHLFGGQISNAFSTGKVVGSAVGGGLVGEQSGSSSSSISESYATGAVESTGIGGGLVGSVRSIITLSDVFATGAVEGTSNVGGLVGNSTGATINRAYATGKVTGTTNVGGFIGMVGETGTTVTASFWDTEASGLTNAVGTGSIGTGATGKTTTQINSPLTYIDAGWDFANVWGKTLASANTGGIQLRDFSQNFYDNIIGIGNASKTYGEANTSITGAALSGVGAANVKLDFGSAIGQLTDAGDYAYSSPNVVNVTNLVAGQNTFVDYSVGKLTVNKKALTVALQGTTANPMTKVYDGNTTLALGSGNFALSGFVGEQGVGALLNGVTSGSFNDAKVLLANTVSANVSEGTLALAQGVKASNYSLPIAPVTAAGTISAKAVQVTGLTAQNKEYDGKLAAIITGTATVATDAFIENDDVSVSGSISGALFADKNAGNDIAVSVTGLSLNGKDASNYQVTTAGLKANITQRLLTISGSTVTGRDYDGTKAATVVVGTLDNLVAGETLGTTTASGTFADKDAGSNKNVTVAYTLADGATMTTPGVPAGCTGGGATLVCTGGTPGTTIPGAKASNYMLANETLKGSIAQKAVTVLGIAAEGKTYDGNTNATLSNQGAVATGIEGESLAVTTTGSFNDKNAGARKVNTTTTIASTGDTLVSNYTLSNATNAVDASIAQKAVLVAGIVANGKTYDGNTTATLSNQGTVATGIDGETLTVATTGSFNDKNAGDRQVNTLTMIADNGTTLANNYSLSNSEGSVNATIAQRALTITGSTVTGRDYDGTKAATVVVGTLSNLVDGETLGTTAASATFADKDAGSKKNVTVAYTLADGLGSFTTGAPIPGTGGTQFEPPIIVPGALASNYTLANETLKGSIAQKAVTVSGIMANGKTYDGNTTATLSNQGTVVTGVSGESLAVSTTGSFNNKNAGARKVNTTTTIASTGDTLVSNYTLSNASNSVDATIAQKAVTVAGIVANGKTYDGNTTATLSNQGTVATGIDGETLTVATTGSFNNKNAGDRQVNTLTTIADNGTTLANNYSLSNSEGSVNATIAQRALTITGSAVTGRDYDGTKAATVVVGTLNNLVEGETLGMTTASGTFADKDAGKNKDVTVTYTLVNGASNLTAKKSALSSDSIIITDIKPVEVPVALASNYSLAGETLKGSIDQRAVTVTGIVANGKTYDGNTNATLSNQGAVATGIEGESLAVTTTGSFDKKHAGARKVNTTTAIANGTGALVSNYTLTNATNAVDATIEQKSLTIAATATNKVYDGKSTAEASLSTGDLVTDDKVTLNQTAANFVNAQGESDKNVGKAKTVKISGLSLTGDDALNYKLNNEETVTLTKADITAKSLSISATASDKVYNANTMAEVTLSTADKIEGDSLTLNKTAANFDTKHVGTGKSVTVEGLSLDGADAGNYSISNANAKATDTADISKAELSVSGITAGSKTYDGTADATVSTASAKLNGLFDGDKLTVSATGEFEDKKAGAEKTVNLTSTYAGDDVGNYSITDQKTAEADITAKSLTITAKADNKVYDGKSDATVTLATTDLIGDDEVTLGKTAANFVNAQFGTDKNVGIGKQVLVTGLGLTGKDAENYTVINEEGAALSMANITAKALTISGSKVATKTYNGLKDATVMVGTLNGVVAGETLGLTTAVGTFNTKSVGTAKDVIVAYTLVDGSSATKSESSSEINTIKLERKMTLDAPALASNYTLAGETLKGDITQAALTIGGITAVNKTYDGTTDATVSTAKATYKGLVDGDKLTVSATGVFENKKAGVEKTVNLTSTYAGDDVGNYSIIDQTMAEADIAQKSLTIAATATNKVYDGKSTATAALSTADLVTKDKVTLNQTAANFVNAQGVNDKNVGKAKTVKVSGLSLTGNDALNYKLNNEGAVATTKADITAKSLMIAAMASDKVYNASTMADVTLSTSDKVEGDVLTLNKTAANFDTKHVGTGKTVTVEGLSLGGVDAGNYAISNTNAKVIDTADISQAALSVSGITASSKTYDGTANATVSTTNAKLNGLFDGDKLSVSATGSFAEKTAATGKTVTLSSAYSGADVSNYAITNQTTTKADINQKSLTIAATATNKVYDGKSTATATLSTADVVTNDKVTLNQTAANFINANQENDKNVGQNKTVRVTGLSLSGDDALNYKLNNEEAVTLTKADITAKSLSISAMASDKVYNANTAATVTLSTKDKVEGDTLTLNKTAANFDTKNVGTGKTVTVEGLNLGGADASNYSISNANAKATDTADISKAELSVSGITAANKTYDGTANATVSTTNAKLNGLFEGDKLSVSATGSFANKTAELGKAVTLSSSYSGADVGNYNITDQATVLADINKLAGVKVTADAQAKTVGATDPALTFKVTGLLAGDELNGGLVRDAGEAAGLYNITQGSLANENYIIDAFTPAQLTISQPIADVAIANASKIEVPSLQPSLGERDDIEESNSDIQPFMITANQTKAAGPAQLVVVNGGIRLPAGQQEEN